jgi:hypothetical protein
LFFVSVKKNLHKNLPFSAASAVFAAEPPSTKLDEKCCVNITGLKPA